MFLALFINMASAALKVGFYGSTCPSAEAIVDRAVSRDPGIAAAPIRMHFPDFFSGYVCFYFFLRTSLYVVYNIIIYGLYLKTIFKGKDVNVIKHMRVHILHYND